MQRRLGRSKHLARLKVPLTDAMNGSLFVLLSSLVALGVDRLLALDDMLGDGEYSLEGVGIGATSVLGGSVEIDDFWVGAVVVVDDDLKARGSKGESDTKRKKATK